jgi:hypothetical protein
MLAHKLTANVPFDRRLEITLPENFPEGEAEVIVLTKPALDVDTSMSLREVWLKRQTSRRRGREAIDAQIAEERDAWEDR